MRALMVAPPEQRPEAGLCASDAAYMAWAREKKSSDDDRRSLRSTVIPLLTRLG